MNRLDTIFGAARDKRRLLIPYVCAGDPDADTTAELLRAFGAMGVEIVEVGIPFSDPVGDGRSIASATQRALDAGMTVARTLELCASVRDAPAIVLFTYLNPIARYGFERFAADARDANVCGVIVVDLPFERRDLVSAFGAADIAVTYLIAPSTPLARAVVLAQASDAFAYVVSRFGVTGTAHKPQAPAVAERLARLRAGSERPLAVGFGIAAPGDVRALAPCADALVVGSGLVEAVAARNGQSAVEAARRYLEPLVAAAAGA